MALRTVESKKRTLHTQNKQIRRTSISNTTSPGESSGVSDGQMPKTSGRLFIPEDKQGNQPSKDGEIKSGKRLASGKVLHTAARSGMDAVNNHVEGGEELKESEEILMALGAAGKRVFQTRKQRQMNRAGVSNESGTSSGGTRRSASRSGGTTTAGDNAKEKQLKNKKDSKKKLREKQRANSKRRRYRRNLRRRRKRYEDDDKEESTPIGIKERLIHGLRVRDSEEDSADNLGSVTKGAKGLKRVIKIILFLIKKLITLLMTPFIIVIVVIVILVALIVGIFMMIIYCSPLSIFFPLPDTGTDDIRMVLSSYYQEFNQKVAEYEADGMKVTYQNTQDGVVTVNFKDTLMVYMTLYSDGQPGYIMDENGKANLRKVFNEMNYIERASSEHEVKVGESLGKVYVTAYCPCKECSGPHGHATASGKKAKEGRTVAVDAYNPIVPMGTKVVIDGHVYTVEDTGDLHHYGNEFDIFYEKHEDTGKWGRKKVEVFVADKDGKIKKPDKDDDDGTDRGEPDVSGTSNTADDGETVTVKSDGIIVHNLTYKDYIDAHPELNDDQKKMIQMLMEEQTSIYGGGSDIGQNVVNLGMTKIGCHYSQARRFDEGYYDCSSFVLRMYREFGLELPGTAAEQGRYCATQGMIINKEDLRPGDLIFYSYEKNDRYKNISHVAMYAGDGKMIHAANPRRGVVMDPLRTGSVVFYGRPYVG